MRVRWRGLELPSRFAEDTRFSSDTYGKFVIEPFERANPGIRVRIATGLTMQTAALMRAQRDDVRVDVIMMDEVGAAQANAENLYEPLTAAAVPNIETLYPQFRIAGDPYTKFMYVSQVIAYDRSRIRTPPASYRDLWRPEYRNRVAIPGIDTSHGVHFSHANLAIDAAVDGLGVIVSVPALAQAELAAGRLMLPFARQVPSDYAYYIVCDPVQASRPVIVAFRNWLLDEAGQSQGKRRDTSR